jgi:hypothetical protein
MPAMLAFSRMIDAINERLGKAMGWFILAAVIVPLVLMTVIPALRARYDRHKKWARITLPLWLYVSVTGVIVYLMLYIWFPSAQLAG